MYFSERDFPKVFSQCTQITETSIFVPCLKMGRVTIPKIITNPYSVPMIIEIKIQRDLSTTT
jgi:hypothetical protein